MLRRRTTVSHVGLNSESNIDERHSFDPDVVAARLLDRVRQSGTKSARGLARSTSNTEGIDSDSDDGARVVERETEVGLSTESGDDVAWGWGWDPEVGGSHALHGSSTGLARLPGAGLSSSLSLSSAAFVESGMAPQSRMHEEAPDSITSPGHTFGRGGTGGTENTGRTIRASKK